MSSASTKPVLMPVRDHKGRARTGIRQIANEIDGVTGFRRWCRKPLPGIRQMEEGAAGLPATDATRGCANAKIGRKMRGTEVALVLSTVTDSSPVTFDSVVVGQSPRMRTIFDFVRLIADSESNVLIVGETGTGKETIAGLIHNASRRRRGPLVAVSCAILTETLIESELFGHERGAFTGALKDHAGRFEMANGGTIFLDDIDDVPRGVQVKLLRVLQNRTIERVGGTHPIPIDVRVITGSKRSLQRLAEEGEFREDLFYRLNVVPIVLPPLRERREDVAALTDHFLRKFTAGRIDMPGVSPVVRQAFGRYHWPGNVRELENACERIAQTCTCSMVRVGCLPASVLFGAANGLPIAAPTPEAPRAAARVSLDARLHEVEAHLIGWALEASHGNKSRAAELLRIKRSTLGDRIRRLGLDHPAAESAPAKHETQE